MSSKLTQYDERLRRADHHASAAARGRQTAEQIAAELLADLRAWCANYGVSFAQAISQSFARYIHDRLNK